VVWKFRRINWKKKTKRRMKTLNREVFGDMQTKKKKSITNISNLDRIDENSEMNGEVR